MAVIGTVVRRRVPDQEAALPFYEQLTGQPAHRFAFSGARLASIGPFLLFSADGALGDQLARVAATLVVDDLDAQLGLLASLGAELIAPASATPNGRRAVVRHPDGAVFEYVST
jgi:predicted enzyme related to lactoylglutathione lyase